MKSAKTCCTVVMKVILLQVWTSQCAPVPPLLRPGHQGQQLLDLQQLDALQRTAWPPHLSISPIIILIQNGELKTTAETSGQQTKRDAAKTNANKGIVDEDLDSVIIEADPEDEDRQQGVLLLPSRARLSIGDVISAIPFLPIEINVPDTIGWAYNGITSGISSIISIFGRQPEQGGGQAALRAGAPLLLLPRPQLIPIRLPVQV